MPLPAITVSSLAGSTLGAITSPFEISAARRGPGSGSTTLLSHETPPMIGLAPWNSRQCSATASAPTTSPPPPMPMISGRLAVASSRMPDAPFGDHRGHKLSRRDVERVVRGWMAVGGHLARVALLDRD